MTKKAIVVGGGIAGVALSRSLSARSVNVKLFERSPQLCSGATWHAAGLVTRFAGSTKLKKLHVRSLDLLSALHDEFDIRLHRPGSIRIIETNHPDRLKEAHYHFELARLYDNPTYPTRLVSPSEIRELHPLCNTELVECGIWTPSDGDVDPTMLTNCVAKLARQDGAQITVNSEVTQIEKLPNNRFAVHVLDTKTQEVSRHECDILVNAAGLWSKHVTQLIDPENELMSHPAFIIEHQYAITEEIPEIAALSKQGRRLPVLRDLRGSAYIRQERNGLLIGPYEKDCRVRNFPDSRGEWKMKPPSNWGMELFPDQMDRIEENVLLGIDLIPKLAEVGFINCTNGPTIWTGDSLARCGATLIPNYYDFNTLTYGIAQSLPLAEYLTHLILEGEQSFDATAEFSPLRYGTWANEKYTFDKIRDTYSKNNAVSYGAFENRPAGREHVSPVNPDHGKILERLTRQDAVLTFSSGVEVPAFFSPRGKEMKFARFDHHEWTQDVQAEAENILTNVGISYSSFSKIRVQGAGAHAFLNKATTNAVSNIPGRCRLTYAITPKGRVQAEFTITKEETPDKSESFYVVGSRDYADADVQWFRQQLLAWGHKECGSDITVTNISNSVDIVHIAGPRSRMLLSAIHPAFETLEFLRQTYIVLDGVKISVFRVSFTGCPGFELHIEGPGAAQIYELIVSHPLAQELGLKPFGSYAVNSLRIETGFKIKSDLDFVHYSEAGIEPFISKKKEVAFLGRNDSVLPTKRAAMFHIETEPGFEWSIPGDTPVCIGETIVGYTTTAAFGASTKQTIAMGYLFANAPAGAMTVRCYGKLWRANLLPKPARDVDKEFL